MLKSFNQAWSGKMKKLNLSIDEFLGKIEDLALSFGLPMVTRVGKRRPFRVLISTLLSLRTKDEVTEVAQEKLFIEADTPVKMLKLTTDEIEKLIYPVGFFRRKAKNLKVVSQYLLDNHNGKVPKTMEELLAIPGVGRKTANLVLIEGHELPGICVDTHVHRIFNRIGYVKTKNADETEMVLREILPEEWWMRVNNMLVTYGQNICGPISPYCSKCPAEKNCPKLDVKYQR